MLYVYVLMDTHTDIDSGECSTNCFGVFGELEDAKKELESVKKDARWDFEDYDTEEEEKDFEMGGIVNEITWSIWEKDYYCSHRIDLKIERVKLQ